MFSDVYIEAEKSFKCVSTANNYNRSSPPLHSEHVSQVQCYLDLYSYQSKAFDSVIRIHLP